MREVIIQLPNKDYELLLSLAQKFHWTTKKKAKSSEAELLNELAASVEQVKQHQKGKIKLKTARELLNEL